MTKAIVEWLSVGTGVAIFCGTRRNGFSRRSVLIVIRFIRNLASHIEVNLRVYDRRPAYIAGSLPIFRTQNSDVLTKRPGLEPPRRNRPTLNSLDVAHLRPSLAEQRRVAACYHKRWCPTSARLLPLQRSFAECMLSVARRGELDAD